MKKLYLILIALIAISAQSWAYDFSATAPSGQTLYYNIVDGNAQVTYQTSSLPTYTNLTGSLTIPSSVTYNGTTYSVTSIGEDAFRNCTGLTSVTIPNSITLVERSAFEECSGLTSVIIGNSVTGICPFAFNSCSGLTSVTIGNSVTAIGTAAFSGCSGLTSVTIPNSVTSIYNWAFAGCSGLTSVTFGNSVTFIDEGAFHGCSGLTSVTIPNSVTSIDEDAFSYCSGLTSIVVQSGNSVYDSRNNCNAIIKTATNTLLYGCQNTVIPNSVTSIGEKAFYMCSGLTSITIPNSVTSIGEMAFYGCSGFTEIHSLNSVPPTAYSYTFGGVPTNTPVYIPCGRISYYTAADGWSSFTNFIEASAASFSAVSNNSSMGTVQVLTLPTCTNPQAVVYASANSGYQFDHWSDNSTSNPYSLTVNEDMELIAYFRSTGSNGIDDIAAEQIKIYSRGSEIVIEGADNSDAIIYDIMGSIVHKGRIEGPIHVNAMGVYMVKIANHPSHKVVVK